MFFFPILINFYFKFQNPPTSQFVLPSVDSAAFNTSFFCYNLFNYYMVSNSRKPPVRSIAMCAVQSYCFCFVFVYVRISMFHIQVFFLSRLCNRQFNFTCFFYSPFFQLFFCQTFKKLLLSLFKLSHFCFRTI